jgi:hypothetical protein
MTNFKDGSGVVFDLRRIEAESFVDNFKLLKERQGKNVDFDVKICSQLPDVEGSGYDAGRPSKRRDDYSSGGGGNYGSRGAGGGDRQGGSRGGGYGDRDQRRDGGSKSNNFGKRDESDRSGGWGGGASGWGMNQSNITYGDDRQNRGHSYDPHLVKGRNYHEESKADYSD